MQFGYAVLSFSRKLVPIFDNMLKYNLLVIS